MNMIASLVFGLVPALLLYQAGVDPWLCGLLWWVAVRLEMTFDLLHALVRIEVARGQQEQAHLNRVKGIG